jgi:glycosyltransferase involved in cell wall biosynthesis
MNCNTPAEHTKWPFMFVVEANGHGTDWVVLHAPIQSGSRKALFADYRRRGLRFLGMTSFMAYPRPDDDDPLDYDAVCEAWCHCFTDPAALLPGNVPRTPLALSDFTDPASVSRARLSAHLEDVPSFDFLYVGDDRPWKMAAKNWPLALACLPELCDRQRLRGLLIGVPPSSVPRHPRITVWPWLPRPLFLRVLARSGCLFVPNELDASPRVLAEALCLEVPIVVNRGLIGGRRYVTPQTGVLFSGVADVAPAVTAGLSGTFGPREWFCSHSGPAWASRQLVRLLRRINPAFRADEPLCLSYARRAIVRVRR